MWSDEQHNLRAALTWSGLQDRWDLVGRLAGTMNRIWIGDVQEGRRWLAGAMDRLDDLDPEQRVRVLAVAARCGARHRGRRRGPARRAADERPGVWSSLAHGLLCLNHGLRGFLSKGRERRRSRRAGGPTGHRPGPRAGEPGLAWF